MTDRRCMATFQPQQWIFDNAVDSEPSYQFDITDAVEKMGRDVALTIEDSRDASDYLWFTWISAHPEVERHDGPFSVYVEDAIRAYFGVER